MLWVLTVMPFMPDDNAPLAYGCERMPEKPTMSSNQCNQTILILSILRQRI